jgi:hypothetical protein
MTKKWINDHYVEVKEPDWLNITLWFLVAVAVGLILYVIFYA